MVITHGYVRRLIQENVSRHENGVGQETDSIASLTFGLFLELSHAGQFAIRRRALQQPTQLSVSGDMALHKHGRYTRVKANGEQRCDQLPRILTEFCRINIQGQRMEINDGIEA